MSIFKKRQKVVASVVLYDDDECTVKGNMINVAKMYIGCKETLKMSGLPTEIIERAEDAFGAVVKK